MMIYVDMIKNNSEYSSTKNVRWERSEFDDVFLSSTN